MRRETGWLVEVISFVVGCWPGKRRSCVLINDVNERILNSKKQ